MIKTGKEGTYYYMWILYVDNRAGRKINGRWNGSEGAKTRT